MRDQRQEDGALVNPLCSTEQGLALCACFGQSSRLQRVFGELRFSFRVKGLFFHVRFMHLLIRVKVRLMGSGMYYVNE